MRLISLRDDLADIHRALDEAESTRDPERRRERLEQALLASVRAIEAFLRDQELGAAMRNVGEKLSDYEDAVAMTLQDAMLFGAFLQAERRLFIDLGLDPSLADRLIAELQAVARSPELRPPDPETLEAPLRELVHELTQARERIHDEETHEKTRRLLHRVFLIVGGSFVCGANALVGAGLTPVTGGLSIAGAAVSSGLGGALVGKGVTG